MGDPSRLKVLLPVVRPVFLSQLLPSQLNISRFQAEAIQLSQTLIGLGRNGLYIHRIRVIASNPDPIALLNFWKKLTVLVNLLQIICAVIDSYTLTAQLNQNIRGCFLRLTLHFNR